MEKVLVSWSGGKDSTMALYEVIASGVYQVVALLTTLTKEYDRISMHGVRRILLEAQAKSLGFPLEEIWISKHASNDEYELIMAETLRRYQDVGVTSVIFGDIFLEDLKAYREKNLHLLGMTGTFPLWKRGSAELMQSFISLGFKAMTVCVDTQTLDRKFVGRLINEQFQIDFPEAVDICGENGEYHSFVYDGPIFKERVALVRGEIVLRDDRFYFCDLIPVQ